ncbi:hypothetical protein FIBSPDRAFT_872777 [Athelia psychrophila]|uniref:Uncharacterized protein n=1 Tax=Athelia psychrophila TaxID=1759441 RepID=A0A165ZA59_9AGAM|nr:hypothetical protein FIBSPDRAFT_872777 [Fibularhizoctonia sp. CBS 109695]
MPLGALEVEKSSASEPGSGFKADQRAGESRVLRFVFFNFSVRLLGLSSGRRCGSMSTQDPRERPQSTDRQLCIAIRLAFTLLRCLSSLLRASSQSCVV